MGIELFIGMHLVARAQARSHTMRTKPFYHILSIGMEINVVCLENCNRRTIYKHLTWRTQLFAYKFIYLINGTIMACEETDIKKTVANCFFLHSVSKLIDCYRRLFVERRGECEEKSEKKKVQIIFWQIINKIWKFRLLPIYALKMLLMKRHASISV